MDVSDFVTMLGWLVVWGIGLLGVWILVASLWDGLVWPRVLAHRVKQAKAVGTSGADLAGVQQEFYRAKALRRQAEGDGWDREFLDSLGKDRAEFVRQWSKDGDRLMLARELKGHEDTERAAGRMSNAAVLERLRSDLGETPGSPVGPKERDRIESYVYRLEQEQAEAEEVRQQLVDEAARLRMVRMASGAWRM